MNYNSLGKSGLKISELSLGGWTTFGHSIKDKKTAKDIIYTARDLGVNFFDIADIYAKGESEKLMGSILKDFPRHTLVISSKVFWPMSDDINDKGLSRKHIMESIDKTLKRIGTDYLDMYFCHRYDPETPVEEVVRTMDDLVHRGKILYWGTSEWSAEQISEALDVAQKYNLYRPQMEQPQYNLLARKRIENEIAPLIEKYGMGMTSFSPLALGMLTGKYDAGIPNDTRFDREGWLKDRWYEDNNIRIVKEFKKFADELGVRRAQLAIAWLLKHDFVSSVITGATSTQQVIENLKSSEINISDDLFSTLNDFFNVE